MACNSNNRFIDLVDTLDGVLYSDSESDDDLGLDDSLLDPSFELPSRSNNDLEVLSNDEQDSSEAESEDEFVDDTASSSSLENEEPWLAAAPASVWSDDLASFQPRLKKSLPRNSEITNELKHSSSIFDIFLKLWPYGLFIQMAYHTNQRLRIYGNEKKRKIRETNPHEMMCLVGCIFVMCYNRLPDINSYWSSKISMGNALVKSIFSRDRFKLIFSKLYINYPEKPDGASKTYYVEELFSCLLQTFQKTRQDSPFQSINKSMTKFKGRSSLKQYTPMKPTKRGIKIWMRCDSQTGYVYDIGKEEEATQGTLDERVITKLTASIKEKDVTIGFDRFFTSVNLINNLDHAAVGTVMKNRKNMPKDIAKTLKKGEMEFQGNQYGTLCARWMDSKEVTVLTNCHQASKDKVMKKKERWNEKKYRLP